MVLSDIKVNDYIVVQYFLSEKLEDENTLQADSILYIGEEENYQKIKEAR